MPRFPAYPTHKNVIELLDITETNSAGSFRKNLLESTANKAQAIPFIDKTFLVKNIEETLDLIGYSMNFFRALRMMSWLMSVIISLLLILISGLHFSFMIFIFACI